MGTDLCLKTKCPKCGDVTLDVAWLGRAYNYIDIGEDEPVKVVAEMDSRINREIADFKLHVLARFFYMGGASTLAKLITEKGHDVRRIHAMIHEMDIGAQDMKNDLEEYAREFVQLGERRVVADMLADEDGIFTELS